MTTLQFNRLLEEYGSSLYRFCCYLTRSRQSADDLYQETWLKAWERCHQIEQEKNPHGFLLSITMGIWKNYCRKQNRHHRITPTQQPLDEQLWNTPDISSLLPENQVLQQEENILLRQAILSLDEKWRLPLYLYYGQELSVKEISTLLQIPAGTVKSRLSKAREQLRHKMEEQGYDF